MLTQKRLKELFVYDAVEGCFYRKERTTNQTHIGDRFGTLNKTTGYEEGRINNKLYTIHRLVWLYHYGYFPNYIDHKDNNRGNNLLSNLREATQAQNSNNASISKANKTGIKGLFYHKKQRTYVAKICVGIIAYTKRIKQVDEGDNMAVRELSSWLKQMREELHGDFANHG